MKQNGFDNAILFYFFSKYVIIYQIIISFNSSISNFIIQYLLQISYNNEEYL